MLSLYVPRLMSLCEYKVYTESQHPACMCKIKMNYFSNADNNREKGYSNISLFAYLTVND